MIARPNASRLRAVIVQPTRLRFAAAAAATRGRTASTYMVGAWSARLAGFLFYRALTGGKDLRLEDTLSTAAGCASFWTVSFAWGWLTLLPHALGGADSKRGPWLRRGGAALFALGLATEVLADAQKFYFKRSGNKGFCDVGLWATSAAGADRLSRRRRGRRTVGGGRGGAAGDGRWHGSRRRRGVAAGDGRSAETRRRRGRRTFGGDAAPPRATNVRLVSRRRRGRRKFGGEEAPKSPRRRRAAPRRSQHPNWFGNLALWTGVLVARRVRTGRGDAAGPRRSSAREPRPGIIETRRRSTTRRA